MFSRTIFSILFWLSHGPHIIIARKDDQLSPRNRHQRGTNNGRADVGSSPPSLSSVRVSTASDVRFGVFKRHSVVPKKKRVPNNGDFSPRRGNEDNVDGDSSSLSPTVNRAIIAPGNDPMPSLPPPVPCPPAYDSKRTDYVAGDSVGVYDTTFVCRPSPYEKYCNIATLKQAEETMDGGEGGRQEDVHSLWLDAWEEVGNCGAPVATEINIHPLELLNNTTLSSSTAQTYDSPQQLSIIALMSPSVSPSMSPSIAPSRRPSMLPSLAPSDMPSSKVPSTLSSMMPSDGREPTSSPTNFPTWFPTTHYPTYAPTFFPTASPTEEPTLSPSTSAPTSAPTASPLAVSPTAYTGNNQQLWPPAKNSTLYCSSTAQLRLRIELVTDNYPADTSWQLVDKTNNLIMLSSPLEGYRGEKIGGNKMESQVDVRDVCLNTTDTTAMKYEFIIRDSFGDGLCCRQGIVQGYYKLLQYTSKEHEDEWKVLVAGSDFKSKEVHHHFKLRGTSSTPDLEQSILDDQEEDATNSAASISTLELSCPPPERKITIEILTDDFGIDTSWEFRKLSNGTRGSVLAKNERSYGNRELDVRDVCLEDSSLYELTMKDAYGDGLCCRYEAGHYKIIAHQHSDPRDSGSQNQETILHGGAFSAKRVRHLVNTTVPATSDRDKEWLNSHNTRRKYWHAYYNTSYVALLWSESLKAEAQVWADTLLDSCGSGMHHDPQQTYGENAAANSGSGSWGTRRKPELIVARFVDNEVDWEWPANGHLVQSLWRASKYVGCAESHKLMGGKKQCHTQVCRYARTGNCNMKRFKQEDNSTDWKTPMLEDVNFCGPICPTDGCHA